MASVIFLRGMNLGRRRITNDELAGAFARLGYENPTPYQASGNVILPTVEDIDVAALEAGLEHELGYPVPVFIRTGEHVCQIAATSPFLEQRGVEDGKPQIIFLREPFAGDLAELFDPKDHQRLIDTEIHWLPAAGLADAGDFLKRLDAAVGGTTVRTLGTIQRLAKKLA